MIFPFGKKAVLSADGEYFYIPKLANTSRGGWLRLSDGDWLPFIFWKVRRGIERNATKEEVKAYREMLRSLE